MSAYQTDSPVDDDINSLPDWQRDICRRTRLTSTPDGLVWHCAGNPKHHQIFCKHCVALALAIMRPQG